MARSSTRSTQTPSSNLSIATNAGARAMPVVYKRLHGDVAAIMIVISAAGGAVFLFADRVADACRSVGHRGKPGKEFFSPFDAKIEMTGFRTPSRNVSRQFDIDRYLPDG